MKKYVIGFILGAIIFGSIGSVVAYNYSAKSISYTPSDSSWNVNNVEDAIRDLRIQKGSDNGVEIIYKTSTEGTETYTITENDVKKYSSLYVVLASANDTGSSTNNTLSTTATLTPLIDNEYNTNGYGRLWFTLATVTNFKKDDTITMFSWFAAKKVVYGILK